MITKRLREWVLPLALCLPLGSMAGPYSSMFVFGDSLSDTGNLIASGAVRPFPFVGPYDGGRFSNGPLWVETLATGLGLPGQSDMLLAGGNNYAFAGAETGFWPAPSQEQIPGVLLQTIGIWGSTHAAADPGALYVVAAGANDLRGVLPLYSGNSAADQAGRQAAAENAINNLGTAIGFLASKGARNFLLATLPNLGYTPEANLAGAAAAATDAGNRFNAMVPALLALGSGMGLNMTLVDMAAVGEAVHNDPASFGITNTTAPCVGFAFSLGDSCDVSAFSDVLHPSAKLHALFGQAALDVLDIPEPDALMLVALALLALGFIGRRAQADVAVNS